ncbi:hypothetical protein EPIR_3158 [Erwinia piriflorinigrans CFBP 5888]|uniref:Uncharacterized protein n=1 Tax=Erwinia piriflorinigrans CFBP 5888 TaxID=1161919 RepID=V5ZC78_9GAMM|nr:hypothetical protein EPIR_3158 [Erwinia piriflorinigrans CFBP 5888]
MLAQRNSSQSISAVSCFACGETLTNCSFRHYIKLPSSFN